MINLIKISFYLFLTVFSILIAIQVWKTLRIYLIYKKKYGNQIEFMFFPLLGLIYFMQKSLKENDDGAHFIKKVCREKPHVKAIIILSGLFNYFIAIDNEWIKFLSQDQDRFYKNDGIFAFSKMYGDSLLFTWSKMWKRQRALLNSSFHYDSLKARVPIIKDEAKNFCNFLKPEQGFVKVDMFDETQKITSEIITRTFFNREFKNKFISNGKSLTQEIGDITQEAYNYRLSSPYFILKSSFLGNTGASFILNSPTEKEYLQRMDQILKIIEQDVDQSIQEVISTGIDIFEYQPRNFIEIYIKEYLIQQKNLKSIPQADIITKKEIVQQYLTFYFAGTETTAHLISMTLYALANNKQVYEKLMKEIKENIKQYDEFQHNNLLQLNYLDLVIKESTRLYVAAPFIFPRVTNQDYKRENLFIRKDLLVMYKIAQYSEDQSQVFKDSDLFIPERFLNGKINNPYEMIPFSSGSRNCIGQHMAILEAKYILIHILMNFEIEPVPNYKLSIIQKVTNAPLDQKLVLIKRK
nr:cytochrome P450 monooxygenase CYP5007C1 [Tetrahymena thermophila]